MLLSKISVKICKLAMFETTAVIGCFSLIHLHILNYLRQYEHGLVEIWKHCRGFILHWTLVCAFVNSILVAPKNSSYTSSLKLTVKKTTFKNRVAGHQRVWGANKCYEIFENSFKYTVYKKISRCVRKVWQRWQCSKACSQLPYVPVGPFGTHLLL